MSLVPAGVTISQVFNKKYEVDFYQRDYKWNDSKQSYKPITSLLNDIFYRFELAYREDIDVTKESISNYDWYYLNSYMTNTINGKTFIVDGQQRLTTISILIINLLHLANDLQIEDGVKDFLKTKVCGFSSFGDKVFWVGFEDRVSALQNILEYGNKAAEKHIGEKSLSESNVYDAYNLIYSYIRQKIKTKHKFKAFQLYLFEKVILVNIDVDDSKDVAMAFEVINDRGIPLTAYEILKGKLLGLIDKIEVETYVDSWNKSINNILTFGSENNIDDFFSTYFRSKYIDNVQQYRELETDKYHKSIYLEGFNSKIGFKHENSQNKTYVKNVKNFVKKIFPYYSNLYSRILRDHQSEKPANNHIFFNNINDQTGHIYLLMSAIECDDPLLDEKYSLIAKLFDRNYSILNLTGSYRSNTFNESIVKLGISIRNKSIEVISNEFDQHLLSEIKAAHNREDIQEMFKYELFSKIGYNDLPKRFSRYLFARVDNFISFETKIPTADYNQMVKQAQGKNKHDIEHILTNRVENVCLFKDEEEFNEQRNRLGGLLLLKSRDNRSSNDELYENKLKTYSGVGTIFAKTLTENFYKTNPDFKDFCKKYNLNFRSLNKFGPNEIEERQKLLFSICKIIWEIK